MKWFLLLLAFAVIVLAGLIVALVQGYRATIRRYIAWSDEQARKDGRHEST